MKEYTVKILEVKQLTHDVKGFRLEKPEGYIFSPGQAASIAVSKKGWKDEKRPFTFTGLPGDDDLELVIKIYKSHEGVTNEIDNLDKGDKLIIGPPWGSIKYSGEGVFIAGGSGITPFISILRSLQAENAVAGNKLLFANNTAADIILEDELRDILGSDNFINILAKEEVAGYRHGFIDRDLLEEFVNPHKGIIYLCGPPPMMKAVEEHLGEMGVSDERLVKESF